MINILDFGAVADGVTDNTKAIQSAIDKAAENEETVFIPEGRFLTGMLKMHPHTALKGEACWSYRKNGGSTLVLNDKNARCLVDITGAFGVSITSLCMEGGELGNGIHGIMLDWDPTIKRDEEDTPTFDNLRISNFSGDAIHLNHIWCFSLRHCMLGFNQGNGLYIDGWDGFVIDNWFSYNKGAGVLATENSSSLTFTGNRVEWNCLAGFRLYNPINVNITGNCFDASGGYGLDLNNPRGKRAIGVTITGNIFHRSGMPKRMIEKPEHMSAHVHLCRVMNSVMTGNVFYYGIDDDANLDMICPKCAIIVNKLQNCTIKDNTLMNCATKEVYLDLGGHLDGVHIDIKGTVKGNLEPYWYPFFED